MPPVKIGVFDHLDRSNFPLSARDENRPKLIEAWNRAGFDAYHVVDHRATPLGMGGPQ
jgi:hypothetical protein